MIDISKYINMALTEEEYEELKKELAKYYIYSIKSYYKTDICGDQ